MIDEKFPFDKDLKIATNSSDEVAPELTSQSGQVAKEKTKPPAAIQLDERGLFKPTDNSQEYRIAEMLLNTNAVPKSFETVPQILMALQFLKSLNLTMTSLRLCAIINGSLSLWGEAPKALCDKSGLMEEFEEFLFDKDYKKICFENKNLDAEVYGALCRVKRKGIAVSFEKTFTVSDAKAAGLWMHPKKDPWLKYPKRMLQFKARSWCLRDALPDVLQGIGIAEYDHDVVVVDGGVSGESSQLTSGNTLANKLIEKHLKDEAPKIEEPIAVEGSRE